MNIQHYSVYVKLFDPKYCEIAQKRVDAELAQTKLDF